MSEMPIWFAWLVLICGLAIFAASMLYVREYFRYRKAVRGFNWPKVADDVSIAAQLIQKMDSDQLQDLSNRTGIQLRGGHST